MIIVDLEQLKDELSWMVNWAAEGHIWQDDHFKDVPQELQRINDIAFSGDGEPTTYQLFDEVCQIAADLRSAYNLDDVKIITLSNMTMLHREQVQRGFKILSKNNGEIWAKLDAGTPAYYERIDRSAVKFERTLQNIQDLGTNYPGLSIVIQSLMMKVDGVPIPTEEFQAYLDRIQTLINNGCNINLVQLYTIARDTAESFVTPLENQQLDSLANTFKQQLPDTPCEVFYGG